MGFLNIVLGILLVLGGFSCLFTPIMTFINVGYLLIILFFVYGIAAIVRAISTKSYGALLIFVESGFNLIALGSVQKAVENGTDEV